MGADAIPGPEQLHMCMYIKITRSCICSSWAIEEVSVQILFWAADDLLDMINDLAPCPGFYHGRPVAFTSP